MTASAKPSSSGCARLAMQENIRGGELPSKDPDGRTFLKVPVNAL